MLLKHPLSVGLSESMKVFNELTPVIHISAHGSQEGVQFTTGESITWDELRLWLKPINKALNGMLLLCMSSCHGYSGIRMAMDLHDEADPFLALIGNGRTPTWPETAVAFTTLYHLLGNGHYLKNAVSAMYIASGNPEFYLQYATQSKQSYTDYLNNLNLITPVAAERVLEEQKSEHPAELKKWLHVES
jgi:hypothetical protein